MFVLCLLYVSQEGHQTAIPLKEGKLFLTCKTGGYLLCNSDIKGVCWVVSVHWFAFSLFLAVFMISTVIMERILLCTSLHTCVYSCWASIWFTCQVCFMLFVSVAWGYVSRETCPIILHLVRFDHCVCVIGTAFYCMEESLSQFCLKRNRSTESTNLSSDENGNCSSFYPSNLSTSELCLIMES